MDTSTNQSEPGSGGGRGRNSGRGGGRNPWGKRGKSPIFSFIMIKPGTSIIWSKWISGAKEKLRPQYGSGMESMERVLPDEQTPMVRPELTAAAISIKANI